MIPSTSSSSVNLVLVAIKQQEGDNYNKQHSKATITATKTSTKDSTTRKTKP